MKEYQSQIQKALNVAVQAHSNFRFDDKVPYIIHPLEVLKVVCQWGVHDIELAQATLLHDTVEDTELSLQEIEAIFGAKVASLVQDLTFRSKAEGEDSKDYQKAKSQHLGEFASKQVGALVIKCADRICNVYDFMQTSPDYAVKYFNKAKDLFSAMVARQQEIEDVFGEEVFNNMIVDHGVLSSDLECLPKG